jgi:hypothetical protein
MKKFIISILVAVAAVSCVSLDGYQEVYTATASFEFNGVDYSKTFDENCLYIGDGGFAYGEYVFTNKSTKDGDKKTLDGGFAMCYAKDTVITKLPKNSYSAYATTAGAQSYTFAVFKQNEDPSRMPAEDVVFYYSTMGTWAISGCLVTNTTEVVHAVLKGCGDQAPFGKGDWMKIVATGYLNKQVVGKSEFFLVDYSKTDPIVKDWTVWELDSLGIVDRVDFEIQVSEGKEKTPMLFCMDNLSGVITVEN